MAWNPEALQKYDDEMRAKRRAQEAAQERADCENEILTLRRQLERAKRELTIAHAFIRERDLWTAFIGLNVPLEPK